MNWDINTEGGNDYIYSGKLDGNGIPVDFFNDIHVRKAFTYCFNYDDFFQQAASGNAVRRFTVMLPGMLGYDENAAHDNYDPSACEREFKQAIFSGKSVWDTGFRIKMAYNPDNTIRKAFGEILRKELAARNSKFVIDNVELSWTTYLSDYRNRKLPLFYTGWIADIPDPHNMVVPFATGTYADRQGLPDYLQYKFNEIIAAGVKQADPAKRTSTYQQFNQLYYEQAPVILLFQVSERYYQQRWVNGWFGNPIFRGIYFYALSKD